MNLMGSDYRNSRDKAQKEFEGLTFEEDRRQASLQDLCTKTLARYDAEIDWYDRHADRRRIASGAVRIVAVVLGTLSVLFLNLRAFSASADLASISIPVVGWEPTTAATGGAIVAGGVLLLDNVFQITARYARWRVAEYTTRVMRSSFEIEFLKQYGVLAEDQIDLSTFQQAKAMALEKFKAVQEEIKAETESWQQGLDKAMTALRQKIEKDTEEAKKATLEAAKADQARHATEKEKEQKRQEMELAKREPVLLDVTIEEAGRPADSLMLLVLDKRKRELERVSDAKPGQTRPFPLIPGPYTVHLFDPTGALLTAKSIRLDPGVDSTLTI